MLNNAQILEPESRSKVKIISIDMWKHKNVHGARILANNQYAIA